MISLALIGKNITHSKSAKVYEKLLNQKIDYKIYDCPHASKIPPLEDIFKNHKGLSITSPYKKFFLDQVELENHELCAINCIKKIGNTYLAINTDYLAISDIVDEFSAEFGDQYYVILGDGVMSQVTCKILDNKQIPFRVISRKNNGELSKLDLPDKIGKVSGQVIIINSCSRDFSFIGELSKDYIFWDYNYDFSPHQDSIPTKVLRYIDGLSLLEIQAKYAIKFWDF